MQQQAGTRDLTSNTLKIIAIVAMTVDHLATGFVPNGTVLAIVMHTIGRLTAPIMSYLVAEGYHYTRDVKRYAARLFLFAAISHFPYVWYFNLTWYKTTSVFWTLALGLVALACVKNEKWPLLVRLGIVAVCCALAIVGDWSYITVLWILCFGIFRGSFARQAGAFAIIGLALYALPGLLQSTRNIWMLGILLAIPLLALYHGRRGKRSLLLKWGFYVYYPLHLLALWAARLLLK